MSEHQRQAAERPAAERYYAQSAALGVGPGDSPEAALQEAIKEGACQNWKLISVTKDPTSESAILVWDISGFFSGRSSLTRLSPSFYKEGATCNIGPLT